MRKLMVAGLLLAGLCAFATPAQAHGRRHGGCGGCESDCAAPCAAPCAPAAPQFVEKVVTCYRTEWKEREVTCTVNRMVPREVVNKHTYTVCVPVWTEEKRTITEYKSVAKVVEKEVTVCHRVPVETPCGDCGGCGGCDDGCGRRHHRLRGHRGSCGGCGGCETPCNIVTEVKKVPCTVYECVPVKRDIMVKVCHTKQEQKTVETKCTVWECKPEVVKKKVPYCVQVPYQTTVKVPVCETSCESCGSCCGGRHHRGHRHHRGGCGC